MYVCLSISPSDSDLCISHKLDDVTRDPKDCITKQELIRADLHKFNVHIDYY